MSQLFADGTIFRPEILPITDNEPVEISEVVMADEENKDKPLLSERGAHPRTASFGHIQPESAFEEAEQRSRSEVFTVEEIAPENNKSVTNTMIT